jgi:hypothetical protein
MQYMALLYGDPAVEPQPGTPGFDEMMAGYAAFTEKVRKAGVFVSGEGLLGAETATSVRLRAGKVQTMDGPFAVTKEVLGGYYILECADLDEAIGWAAQIPAAGYGTVELRPVMVFS